MATIGSLVVDLTARTANFQRGLSQAQRSIKNFQYSARRVTRDLDDLAKAGKQAGLILGAIVGSAVGLTKVAGDFESSMVRVKAVSNATVAEYKAMSSAALELSKTSRYATGQIVDGMNFLAMAGYKPMQILEAMPSVMQLATAGMMDLGSAADITTNVLTGYRMEVEQLSYVNDVLASAMTGANVDLVDLGESFKYAGPVAKGAGQEFETTTAIIALLGNAAIQGSMAGTSLRTAISRLLNPSKEAQRVLKRLGVETLDTSGNLRSLTDIITDLEKSGVTTTEMFEIFGDRAGPAMSALIGQGSDALRGFEDRLRQAGGTAQRIEQEQLQTLAAQFDVTKNRLKAFATTLGQDLLPYAKTANWMLQRLTDRFDGLDEAQRLNIIKWGALSAAVLGLVTVFGVVAAGISVFVKGLLLMGTVVSLVTSPIVVSIALIALGVGLMAAAWEDNWGGIQEKTQAVWRVIAPIMQIMYDWIHRTWNWVVKTSGDAWEWMTETTWADKVAAIKGWLTDVWDWAIYTAGTAWTRLTETTWADKVESIKSWLVGGWRWLFYTAGSAWDWIDANLPWLADTMQWMWNKLKSGWEWAVNTGGDAWDWFMDSKLVKWLDDLKTKITNSSAWKWTVSVTPKIIEAGEVAITAVVEAAGDMYDAIKTGLDTGDWGPFWSVASDVWSKGVLIAVGLSSAITGINAVKAAIVTGLGLIPELGMPGVLGSISVAIQLMEAKENNLGYEDFGKRLALALATGIGIGMFTGSPKAGALAFTVMINLDWQWVGQKIDEAFEPIRQFLGTAPAEAEKYVLEYRAADAEQRSQMIRDLDMPVGELVAPPTWWERIKGRFGFGPEPPQQVTPSSVISDTERSMFATATENIEGLISQIATSPQFDNIRNMLAEWNIELGSFLIKLAESESGLRDITNEIGARGEFQMMPDSIKSVEKALGHALDWDDTIDRVFGSIVFFRMGVEDEFNTIEKAAVRLGITLDEALKLWWVAGGGNLSNLRSLSSVAWTEPSGQQITYQDILDNWRKLPGFSSGTPWTGWGALDEPAGIVHKREAVIPWDVLRKGGLAVLEFLGMPGFQGGRTVDIPGLGAAQTTINTMQDLFSGLGQIILGGIAKLFELIASAIEALAVAFVGEEKLEEIKAVFEEFRSGLEDFVQEVFPTSDVTPTDPETVGRTWMTVLEEAFEQINWQYPIDSFVSAFANGLQQASSLFSQFLGEIVQVIKIQFTRTKDGVIKFMLDWEQILQQVANSLANTLANAFANLFGGSYGAGFAKRDDPFPNLVELVENMENWDKNLRRLKKLQAGEDLGTIGGGGLGAGVGFAIGGPLGALIGGFLGAIGGKKIAESVNAKEIAQLSEKLLDDFQSIKEMLGTTMQDVAHGLAQAFHADTYEDFVEGFSQSLEEQVKNALITAFMASETVRPLIEELSNAISLAVLDGTIDAQERQTIVDLYSQITSVSGDFYSSLQELGIATGDTAKGMTQLNQVLRNVPTGLKIVSNRLSAAGYQSRPVASVAGVQAVGRQDTSVPQEGDTFQFNFTGPVYGVSDLERKIEDAVGKAQRKNRLALHGVR